jgi:Immunity protein 42
MIIGNPEVFAIESGVTQAFERPSFRALGFFVIHVGGSRYGNYEPEATLLACSFDEVKRRITDRGIHTAPFAEEPDASKIAEAFRRGVFGEGDEVEFLGISPTDFRGLFDRDSNSLMWAPDGDEAFDDGSYILQFDVGELVRLIAFRCTKEGVPDDSTLKDVWVSAPTFYETLREWSRAFEKEWTTSLKVSMENDGSRVGRRSV